MAASILPLVSSSADGLPKILGEEHSRIAAVDNFLVVAGQCASDDGSSIVVLDSNAAILSTVADIQRNDDQQVCLAAFPGKPLFVSSTKEGGVALFSLPTGKHERTLMLCPMRVQYMAISSSHLL